MLLHIPILLGGLGLFLYGMKTYSDAVHRMSAPLIRNIMKNLPKKRVDALITGITLALAVQSSSAAIITIVSLVNAGLITLFQSLSIIIGTNLGSLISLWLLSLLGFGLGGEIFSFSMIALSMFLIFRKTDKYRDPGFLIFGLGLTFYALFILSNTFNILSSYSFFDGVLNGDFYNIFILIASAFLLSFFVQSSAVSVLIFTAAGTGGLLSFESSLAAAAACSIGAALSSGAYSKSMSADSNRACVFHIFYKIISVLTAVIIFYPFVLLFKELFSAYEGIMKFPVIIASFYSIINIISAALIMPFIQHIEMYLEKYFIMNKTLSKFSYAGTIISPIPGILDTGFINISHQIEKLSNLTHESLLIFYNSFSSKGVISEDKVRLNFIMFEDLNKKLRNHLISLTTKFLAEEDAKKMWIDVSIVNQYELIFDIIGDLYKENKKVIKSSSMLSNEIESLINIYTQELLDFTGFTRDYILRIQKNPDMRIAEEMEESINNKWKKLKKLTVKSIEKGGNIKTDLKVLNIFNDLERIGDLNYKITKLLSDR